MIKKILITIGLLSTLFIMVACSTANAQKQDYKALDNQEITITDASLFDQNPHMIKQVEIAQDGQIMITLISNASTGFTWNANAELSDSSILAQLKHETIIANSDKVGAPGVEQWTLNALKKGTATVKFDYSRPWEGGEKGIWTLELTVIVK